MTIANDYQNAADWVAGYAHREEPIPPHAASYLAACLLELADQVKHLQDIPLMLDTPETPARKIARRIARGRGEMPHA